MVGKHASTWYMSIYTASEVCDSHLSVTVILNKEFHI